MLMCTCHALQLAVRVLLARRAENAHVHTLQRDSSDGLYPATLIQTVNCSLIYTRVRHRALGTAVHEQRWKLCEM